MKKPNDPSEFFGELPEGCSPPNRIEQLAADYIEKKLAGEKTSADVYLLDLKDEAEKTRFRELVSDVESVEVLLPRQVREGAVLSKRYKIERQLGSGGMGKVFVAFDQQLRRRVAVKVLAGLDTDALDFGELFTRESQLLAQLQHPNIVSIHEATQDGDIRYIVMDLVEGLSLNKLLDIVREMVRDAESGDVRPPKEAELLEKALDRPVPAGRQSLIERRSWTRTAARIVAEVARTLEAAHAHGVLHRDIKPGNVMLRGDGSPVILDFGLAGTMDSETGQLTKGLFGSAAYVAPEQAESNQVGCDARTDVYQLGLLLYEMLTLHRAFDADELSAVLAAIVNGRFDKPRQKNKDVPPELEAIVLKAMEVRPAYRYPSASAFREDLERFLSGTEVPLAARGGLAGALLRDSRYFVRRHKTLCLVAAALVVGVTTGFMSFGGDESVAYQPIMMGREHESLGPLGLGSVVRPGDWIGIDVSTREEAYLYAFSLVSNDDGRTQYLAPLQPRRTARDARKEFGLRLDSGEHRLMCAEVDEYGPGDWTEGLVVLAPSQPQPALEEWMARLDHMMKNSGDFGVPLERAKALLIDFGLTPRGLDPLPPGEGRRSTPRGRSPHLMDPKELKELQDLWEKLEFKAADLSLFAHMRPYQTYFRVER